jgi:hypothetical protein
LTSTAAAGRSGEAPKQQTPSASLCRRRRFPRSLLLLWCIASASRPRNGLRERAILTRPRPVCQGAPPAVSSSIINTVTTTLRGRSLAALRHSVVPRGIAGAAAALAELLLHALLRGSECSYWYHIPSLPLPCTTAMMAQLCLRHARLPVVVAAPRRAALSAASRLLVVPRALPPLQLLLGSPSTSSWTTITPVRTLQACHCGIMNYRKGARSPLRSERPQLARRCCHSRVASFPAVPAADHDAELLAKREPYLEEHLHKFREKASWAVQLTWLRHARTCLP